MVIDLGLLSVQYADVQFLGHLKDKLNQKVNEAVDKKIDKVTSGTGNFGTRSTGGIAVVSKSGGNASLKTYSKYDFAGDKMIVMATMPLISACRKKEQKQLKQLLVMNLG